MKILHIITGLNTGGAEIMLYKLLSATDRSRFESVVVSLMDKGTIGEKIEALGVRIYALNMHRGILAIDAVLRLRKIMCALRPDLIQGWMYHANVAAFLSYYFQN